MSSKKIYTDLIIKKKVVTPIDPLKGSQPPLKKIFPKSGGVDRCSTPPSKIQGGGLRPPNPPPLFGAPVKYSNTIKMLFGDTKMSGGRQHN